MTMSSRSSLSSCKLFTPWYFNEIQNVVLTSVHKNVEALLINPNSIHENIWCSKLLQL